MSLLMLMLAVVVVVVMLLLMQIVAALIVVVVIVVVDDALVGAHWMTRSGGNDATGGDRKEASTENDDCEACAHQFFCQRNKRIAQR